MLVALAAFSAEARADEVVIIGHGASGPATVTQVPADHGGWTLVFRNRMVAATVTVFAFEDGVEGVVVAGTGPEPDEMTITPPVGFYCAPCAVIVPEDDTGVVEILPQVMG